VHRISAGPGVNISTKLELSRENNEEDAEAEPIDLSNIPKPQEL
jgi:hypothetical protein